MRKKLLFMSLAALVILVGCSQQEKISKPAMKVIETVMTCPNEDLFNEDMVTKLGAGSNTKEEQEKIKAASDKARKNWEALLGQYFAENSFNAFLTQGYSLQYLVAATDGQIVTLESMSLLEKSDDAEKVLVTLTIDEQEKLVEVKFRYDEKGLITHFETNELDAEKVPASK